MSREDLLQRISIDPKVCHGRACVRGHRIWVSLILDRLADGATATEVLDDYPGLVEEDIRACIAYGAEMSCAGCADVPGAGEAIHGQLRQLDRIEVDPQVMTGKPVIRGTRVPVELLIRKLAEGATEEELLAAYPRISIEDIRAALHYAALTIAHEE